MIGLTEINEFRVSPAVITKTMEFLAAVGRTFNEALVLWVGTVEGSTANVTDVIAPRQTPLRTQSGIGVYVGPDILHDLNVWLHQHRVRQLGQVHSHGEHAYHSDTDDQHSIVTTLGAISIVVPHFARESFGFDNCSVHRLYLDGWHDLSSQEAKELIRIQDSE
jgi:hypothetical protein